jgi:hypothetical protein
MIHRDRSGAALGGGCQFEIGDRVLVAGPPGEVTGEVVGVSTPDQAPDIAGAPPAAVIKDILREFQVDLLLLIAHKHEDREVCFFALRHPGGWRDLRGQTLTVRKAAST